MFHGREAALQYLIGIRLCREKLAGSKSHSDPLEEVLVQSEVCAHMSREFRTLGLAVPRACSREWASSSEAGVTLLEVTLAVAIFAVTFGVAAQSLVSFYVNMDMQNQRIVAVNHCQSVFSAMRSVRDASPNSAKVPNNCQTAVLAAFPSGTVKNGPVALKDAKVTVTYEDAKTTANPLIPTVTLRWQDLRGHTCTIALSSAITDR